MTRPRQRFHGQDRSATTHVPRRALWSILALILACAGPPPEKIPSRPHPIVIFDIGTLRADHLGCYGYARDTSPNIDALAQESILFQWAFSQAPSTGPSQTSLLTGLYPSTHGRTTGEVRVPEEAVTLAEALADHGYTTAAFVDGGYMAADFGAGQGFSVYDDSRGGGLESIAPKIVDWLRDHAEENFLLLIHSYDVHTPYEPADQFRQMFLEGLEEPSAGFEPSAERMEEIRLAAAGGSPQALPPRDLEYAKALYDGEIRQLDNRVGELLEELRRLGLDQRATIVLVSDHGEEFQEHGSVLHDQLYTPVTRVPLLIRLPNGHKAQEIANIVELVDLAPTLLELAGASPPPAIQGESLVPLIRGEGKPPYLAFGESPELGGRRFVALGGYRMLLSKDSGKTELYHFLQDPLEQIDVAESEPDRIEVLRRHLDDWEERVTSSGVSFEQEEQAMDEKTLEQLKSLGYIQ